MPNLRTLTHEQLVASVASRLHPIELRAATSRQVSSYLSEPGATPYRVEIYKRTRRAARVLTPKPATPAPSGLEMTYADFIATASLPVRPAAAQVA